MSAKNTGCRLWICLFGLLALIALGNAATVCPLQIEWQQTYGAGIENMRSLTQTSDGGYLFGGVALSTEAGDNRTSGSYGRDDFWVVRTGARGEKVWDMNYGGSERDQLYAVVQTADGGFLLGGSSESGASGSKTSPKYGPFTASDFWLVKISANGTNEWDRSYGGFGEDNLNSIVPADGGGFLLAGFSGSQASGTKTSASLGADYWVVRIDPEGNQIWDKSFGGSGFEFFWAATACAGGGFLLGGQSASDATGNKSASHFGLGDFWVVRLDADGNKLWDKSFGGDAEEILLALVQTADGGFLLGGSSESGVSGNKTSLGYGNRDFWVVRIDSAGNKLWERSFGGVGTEQIQGVGQTPDGGFVIGGQSDSGPGPGKRSPKRGLSDYWLIKLNANGDEEWENTFGGNSTEIMQAGLRVTTDGGFVLGGFSNSEPGGNKTSPLYGAQNFWAAKIAPEAVPAVPGPPCLCSYPLHVWPRSQGFPVSLLGEAGRQYEIDYTEDFDNWLPLVMTNVLADSLNIWDQSLTSASQRFYRARSVP